MAQHVLGRAGLGNAKEDTADHSEKVKAKRRRKAGSQLDARLATQPVGSLALDREGEKLIILQPSDLCSCAWAEEALVFLEDK